MEKEHREREANQKYLRLIYQEVLEKLGIDGEKYTFTPISNGVMIFRKGKDSASSIIYISYSDYLTKEHQIKDQIKKMILSTLVKKF